MVEQAAGPGPDLRPAAGAALVGVWVTVGEKFGWAVRTPGGRLPWTSGAAWLLPHCHPATGITGRSDCSNIFHWIFKK